MKKIKRKINYYIKNNKKEFIFLCILYLIGLAFGAIFINVMDSSDKTMVINQIETFFSGVRESSYIFDMKLYLSTFLSYFVYFIMMWLLGISVIGAPIIVFMHFFRGFLLGFTIGAVILKYKLLGLLISFLITFPHHIIIFAVCMFLSFFSLAFSIRIGKSVLKRETVSFKSVINKYLVIFLYSVIGIAIATGFEVFVSPLLIKGAMLIFT